MDPAELPYSFLQLHPREPKPRTRGVTEIRGPYYSVVGPRYLMDLFDTMARYVDILKFAAGCFTLMPRGAVAEMIDLAHEHDVLVSTGGFVEYVLTQGSRAVDRYLDTCAEIGFDIVEISSGYVSAPEEDLIALARRVIRAGLIAKPEVGIQFGSGGASSVEVLEAQGTRNVSSAVRLAKKYLDAGAHMIMVESEGITEQVRAWRTDIPDVLVNALGLERLMFEAADPAVFDWYVHTYGPDVNLFVDHSQIVQLECLRSGIWGTGSTFGRVVRYRVDEEALASQG